MPFYKLMYSLFLTNIHQTSYTRYGKENAMQGALTPAHTLSIRLYLKPILFSPFSESILFVRTFPLTLMDISWIFLSNIILLHLQNNCLVDQVVSPIPPGSLRACLHGGGGLQIGEVTSGGHPTYHVNVIKLI